MSELVGTPEDQFSHVAAHILTSKQILILTIIDVLYADIHINAVIASFSPCHQIGYAGSSEGTVNIFWREQPKD